MIVEQHQSGLLDCLGQMWTWVGVESEDLSAIYGWLEYSAIGRNYYDAQGPVHFNAKGRMSYEARETDA